MGLLRDPGPTGPIGIITLLQIRCQNPPDFGTSLEQGSLHDFIIKVLPCYPIEEVVLKTYQKRLFLAPIPVFKG